MNPYRHDLILSDPSVGSNTTDVMPNFPALIFIFAEDAMIIGAVVTWRLWWSEMPIVMQVSAEDSSVRTGKSPESDEGWHFDKNK